MNKNTDYTKFQNNPLKFISFITEGYRKYIFITIALVTIAEVTTSIGSVYFLKQLTDGLNTFGEHGDKGFIYSLAGSMAFLIFLGLVFWRLSGFVGSYVTTKLEARSFSETFSYLIEHSHKYFSDRLVGKLSSKVSNIASSVESIFPMLFWSFTYVFVKFVIFVTLAFLATPKLGSIFLGFILFFIFFNAIITRKLTSHSKTQADKLSELRGGIVDNLTNILAVKQNVRRDFEIKNIGSYIERYRLWHWKSWRYFEFVLAFNSVMSVAMFSTITFTALNLWESGAISLGIVVVSITMSVRLAGDLVFMGHTFNRFMQQYGQLKEGLEEVFVSHDITDSSDAKSVEIKEGEITFDKVNFNYEEDDMQSVFNDLTLKVPSGQKVGLVGESGAGKSTFVNLLLRFRDVEGGKIMVDNHDIREIRQEDLRRSIAYVPQEALLFHRTLRENIMYSNEDATEEEVLSAARRAHVLEFINKFPDKFDTLVGERGVKLSGGQKQRVMIARAMLKKSPILVLDEATSSLDSNSEKLIQEALEELMKNRTTIVIAHRLSTLKRMDRIVVFDNGKIVEDGTHEELLEKRGKYFDLWQHQSGALT